MPLLKFDLSRLHHESLNRLKIGGSGPEEGPKHNQNAASKTSSKTWCLQARFNNFVPNKFSNPAQPPFFEPVFELVVSKHIARTNYCASHRIR